MDLSASESDCTLNELETIKQQLSTYKQINSDLSKRVQEIKIELNHYKTENARLKEDALKIAEYRRCFSMVNEQCMNFVTQYHNAMQTIAAESDITLVQNSRDENDSPTIIARDAPQRPHRVSSIRTQLNSDENDENVLNTIMEESSVRATSTPILPLNIPRSSQQFFLDSPNISSLTALTTETPRLRSSTIGRRISTVQEDDTHLRQINDQDSQHNEICEESSRLDETSESQSTIISKMEPSQQNRVVLSPLVLNGTTFNQSNDNGQWTSYDTEDSTETSPKIKTRAAKSKANKVLPKKRVNDLPRRRARPDPNAFIEPSLRTKLRRSQDKKKYM